jgi:hypothetical protein
VDALASAFSDASSGNPASSTDADAGALQVEENSADAAVVSAATDATDVIDVSESGPDVAMPMPCGPPTGGTWFVDPVAGQDDDGGTGSQACPLKSLTHAFSRGAAVDAGAAVTVEIVNTNAAPTLSKSTGEVFPITVPGGWTITAEDATRNTPTVLVEPSGVVPTWQLPGCAPPCANAFALLSPGSRVSHVSAVYSGAPGGAVGVAVESGSGVLDHMSIQGFVTRGIRVFSGRPFPEAKGLSVGPGVVVTGSSVGLEVNGGTAAPVTVTGGLGAEHTSFTGAGNAGIVVDRTGVLFVDGPPIDPAEPLTGNVDVDRNGTGMFVFGTATVSGLHAGGNTWGIGCNGCTLTMRGSYVGNNKMTGVEAESQSVDLGSAASYGRNIFVGNGGGDICYGAATAVGNVFGDVDCRVGGKLDPAVTCGNTTSVNVANCTY